MPTLSVLWKMRKETFAYDKEERLGVFIILAMMLLTSFSILAAVVIAIAVFSRPLTSSLFQGNANLEVTFGWIILIASSVAYFLTYGAYVTKVIVGTDEEYIWDSMIMSQFERIKKPLAFLGLETLFISYGLSIKMLDKNTNDVSENVRTSFSSYKWYLKFKSFHKSKINEENALGNSYPDGFKNIQISSHKSNPLSSVRLFIYWKAFIFFVFKMFNRGHDLTGYGVLVLRGATLRSLQACTRLNLTSDKADFLISQKVPVSDYELVKDLPVAWIAKIYSKNTTASNPQNVTV